MRQRPTPHPIGRVRGAAPRTGARLLPALLSVPLLASCATDELFQAPEITEGGPQVPYKTVFRGVEDETLLDLLEGSSRAVELQDRPPATPILLERRGERDVEQLRTVLRSEGYYEATVTVEVDTASDPAQLVFQIDPGPPYRIESVEVTPTEGAEAAQLPDAAALGLTPGRRARAPEIEAAGDRLLLHLQQTGFPHPVIAERRVVVDRRTRAVRVSFRVDPGREARFGPTTITGLERVEESYIRQLIPWRQGERFDIDRFTELRNTLLSSNLFATVRIEGAKTVEADGTLPVTLELSERKRRTITAGVGYETDVGFSVETGWEHRNLFGRGESLQLNAIASPITLSAEAGFRKPAFLRLDQALLAELRVAHDEPDAFTSDNAETQVLIERWLRPDMVAAAGLGLRYARIEENGTNTDEFGLVFLPVRFRWDTSNDLLDPSRGGRLSANLAPFQDVLGSGVRFLRSEAAYTHYLQVFDDPRLVLAGRGAVGSIVGADRDDVPADERFYVGGGGSLRGYSFQKAGELDEDGDPVGGRSFLELSGEVRVQTTETVGFVVFVDAGRAYSSTLLDFDEKLLFGAGAGFRYFTPIGPLRFDVAVPVNPRDSDDGFQLYVSLGQAF